jgi:uncharacterized protein YutE (UPF0331/DUF86 family)
LPLNERAEKLIVFLNETTEYFRDKFQKATRDGYFADRDIRNILDKTINDIILCTVDIAEECLKKHKRNIPDTYKDTVLACYEILGDVSLKIAPLTKCRNETVHQYLKINWHNIITVKNKLSYIAIFVQKAGAFLSNGKEGVKKRGKSKK